MTTTSTPRHRAAPGRRRPGWRRRLTSRRGPVAVVAAALVATISLGQAATPTDAQWSDQAHAEGTVSAGTWAQAMARSQLVEVEGLGLDVLDLVTASAEYPQDPGPDTSAVDVTALESLIGVDLPALELPLVGDGSNAGLLDLGESAAAGALNGYAAAADYSLASAASGAVTDDGAVDLSPIADPSDTDLAQLELTALLDNLSIGALTDQVVNDVALGLGAIASTAEWTAGGEPSSEYVLAGAELRIGSPLVGGLVQALTGAVGALSDTINGLLGPQGPLQTVLNGLSLVVPNIGLVSIDLGTPQLNASVNLDGLLDEILATPLTSDDGLVTVDLSTGTIAVDLRRLVADGDLNGLPANTELLTDENITRVVETVSELLTGVVSQTVAGVEALLDETTLNLHIAAEVEALLGLLPVADVAIVSDITIGGLLAGEELELDVEGNLLGIIPIGTLLSAVLGVLVDVLVTPLTTAVGTLLADIPGLVGESVGAVVGDVTGTLLPVLDPLLAQLLSITVNDQELSGPEEEQTFTTRALAVELLPVLGEGSVTVGLASSSVQVWQPSGSGT